MSFKRQAPSELNHENWNEEDPEDDKVMGQFKAASKDVLEKRVIRTARRRNPVASEPSKSVFSGFGGFNKAQPTSFDFLANLTNGKNTNGATCTSNSVTPGLFTNKATNSGLFGAQSLASLAPQPNQSTMMASPFGTSIKTSQSTLFTNTNQPNQSTMVESPFGTSIKSSQSTLFTNTNQQNRSTMMESPFGTSIESSQSTLFTNKNQPNQSTMMESPFGTSVKSSQSTLFTNTNQPNQSTMMESPFGTSIKSLQSTLFTNTNQSTMMESPIGTSIKTSQSTLFTNTNFGIKETPFQIQPITNTTQPESMKSSAKPTLSVFGVSTTMTNDKKLFTPTPFQIQTSNTNTTMVQTCFGIIVTPTVTTGTPTVTTVTTTVTTVKPTVTTVTPTMNTVRPIVNTVTTEKKTDVVKCRNEKKIKYFSKLKGLNESVSDWISQHVVKTPFCILSPIFKDYEKYLKEITEEYENADKGVSDNMENLESKTQNINTKISPFFDKTGSSPNASNKANEDTEQSGAFGVSSSNTSNNGISNQDTKIPSFGVTNTSSSMVSQNTKMSSPFAINCYTSPSNTQNTKISSPYAVNNTISSLLPISKSLPFGFNNTGSTPLKSQETKTPPFAIANSNVSSFNTSPSNANPKPVFGGQNNPLSSPENKPNFSFGINTSTAGTSIAATPSTGFSFGVTPSAPIANTSSFTISTNLSTNQTNPPPFSFGTGKPFSFSPNTIAQQPNLEKTTAENEEDEPPKVEYTPVKEENSVYEKKCKIFFKKDGNFVDKGVGTLYIKKIEGNEKHQLLVRANTNLGTVLLNLVLAEAIPTQRMGKNNVMLVCIPTPDSKPPPTPILIRVKTAEEADELLETLNKYKA